MQGKMNREDRAKQFMPFAALTGYSEMIAGAQKIPCKRRELTEEQAEYLSRTMSAVSRGDIVTVKFYSNGGYETFEGRVSNIDTVFRKITVIKRVIPFDDIVDIKR